MELFLRCLWSFLPSPGGYLLVVRHWIIPGVCFGVVSEVSLGLLACPSWSRWIFTSSKAQYHPRCVLRCLWSFLPSLGGYLLVVLDHPRCVLGVVSEVSLVLLI